MKRIIMVLGATLLNISTADEVFIEPESTKMNAPMLIEWLQEPDYQNAVAMPLPNPKIRLNFSPTLIENKHIGKLGQHGFLKGQKGSGKRIPQKGIKGNQAAIKRDNIIYRPREFGSLQHPFTTSRVDGYGNRNSSEFPYRPTGKLYFQDNFGRSRVCTASLIKKGVLLTAAHCVWAKGGGVKGKYRNFRFQPAKFNTSLPFAGTWTAYDPTVLTSHVYGWSNHCVNQSSVICNNDVAVLKVSPKRVSGKQKYPGELTGWYGVAWNGFGFTNGRSSYLGSYLAQITQLGYPESHDNGSKMQRTDSIGFINFSQKENIIIGSRQTGGSSGGPWLVNFGSGSALNGASYGEEARRNVVVGVSSWGYENGPQCVMGATLFTDRNIVPLLKVVCTNFNGC